MLMRFSLQQCFRSIQPKYVAHCPQGVAGLDHMVKHHTDVILHWTATHIPEASRGQGGWSWVDLHWSCVCQMVHDQNWGIQTLLLWYWLIQILCQGTSGSNPIPQLPINTRPIFVWSLLGGRNHLPKSELQGCFVQPCGATQRSGWGSSLPQYCFHARNDPWRDLCNACWPTCWHCIWHCNPSMRHTTVKIDPCISSHRISLHALALKHHVWSCLFRAVFHCIKGTSPVV